MSAEHDEPMPEGDEPPPPGTKTMALVRWLILGAVAVLAIGTWALFTTSHLQTGRRDGTVVAPTYQCPMHPQIVAYEPGECPICHMALEPIASGRVTPAPDAGRAAIPDAGMVYTCPMHPEIRSDAPGRCPVCKMALEPMAADGGAPAEANAAAAGMTPPGTAPIQLSLDRIQAIGVRTAVVEERETSGVLRATATIAPPEQGVAEVHVRTPGFVEAIQVAQTGVSVGAGQALFSLYSPELLQAQSELIATRRWGSADGGMAAAARRKLELLGMSTREIDRVVETGEPSKAITIAAPRSGHITKKNVVQGSYVTPEMTLYGIQDLSQVTIVADVFLRDAPSVAVGAEGRFFAAGGGGREANVRVDLIYPLANAEARTRRVRFQIKNTRANAFAPGEYGTVELTTQKRRGLGIPRDALIDTGTGQYVFVVEREGRFVPRTVATSAVDGDRVIVDSGLRAGERVVSGATFLIDSESRLQASLGQSAGPK